MENIKEVIKNPKTSIIDVRTTEEFAGGHVNGSINIPLHVLPLKLNDLKQMQKIVLCCASGGRSYQALQLLRQNGIESLDAGSWLNVNFIKNN